MADGARYSIRRKLRVPVYDQGRICCGVWKIEGSRFLLMKKENLTESNDLRLSDQVYKILMARILSGQMSAGDVIAEKTLAKELGVSRTPVHDALRALIKEGFLIQKKNRRPEVIDLKAADVSEIFEMRALLEGEAAFLAAKRMDHAILNHLRDVGESIREDSFERNCASQEWVSKWTAYEDEFHGGIARASGNRRLYQDIERHRLSQRAFIFHILEPAFIKDGLDEHLSILDALERRDGEKARMEMRQHIQEWQPHFVSKFSD